MAEQTDTQRLAETNDILIGAVENGPWVLIADPNLRKVVGEYVADTCHSVALAAGLDEAMEYAHNTVPQRLNTTSKLIAPDARERLARHLHTTSGGDPRVWDRHAGTDRIARHYGGRAEATDPTAEKLRADAYSRADVLLAVITGQENT